MYRQSSMCCAHPLSFVALKYGNRTLLSALIDEAAARSSRRLVDIMMERFHFWEHCLALKRYMLLGQGDFIQYLLDLLGYVEASLNSLC